MLIQKAISQNNFTGNLEPDRNLEPDTQIFFIIKEAKENRNN